MIGCWIEWKSRRVVAHHAGCNQARRMPMIQMRMRVPRKARSLLRAKGRDIPGETRGRAQS